MGRIRRRVQTTAAQHPVGAAVAATVGWMGVILAATLLPGHALYGPMYVNLIGFAAGLGIVVGLRWVRHAGLVPLMNVRSWALAAPLLILSAPYAVPGLTADAYLSVDPADGWYVLTCMAVWCVLVGLNEELWSRGIILHILARLGRWRSTLLTAGLFANQHWLNLLFFDATWDDQIAQLITTFTFGYVLCALRWRGATIIPLAVLHGLGNFLQLASPGAAPWWWQATIAGIELLYGTLLLTHTADRFLGTVALSTSTASYALRA